MSDRTRPWGLPLLAPPLALLLRLKLRGVVRRQWRRMKTPKGFLLALVGGAAFAIWIGSLAFSLRHSKVVYGGTGAELRVRAFGLMLFILSLSTALTNRGLYLARSEIERLFSAPLSRRELVRYRLMAGSLRSIVGGIVLGLFGAGRMPDPILAFTGILMAMQTLPVVNQFVAIALGGFEQRAARALKRAGSWALTGALVTVVLLALAAMSHQPLERLPVLGPWLERVATSESDWIELAWLTRLTTPFTPWARMISAESAAVFAPWFLVCLGLHLVLVEACARLPIDFRELSLATSARAAARIARVRSGGGVAATRASAGSAGWRIPWIFGRGPVGAIAWRKCAGMARKAKGAFWVALLALAFITVFANLMQDGSAAERTLGAPVMIATLGTIYLCSGLRFDFREELERMDVVRAWPLAPARIFLAVLLPEVLLVSGLLLTTVLAQALLTGGLTAHVLGVAVCLPFLVFSWVALDNLVFLFAPVRVVPGQDGFVQNAGRRMIQMALLSLMAAVLGLFGALGFWGAGRIVLDLLGGSEALALAAGFLALGLVLLAGNLGLVFLGGVVLRRFDVARDRG